MHITRIVRRTGLTAAAGLLVAAGVVVATPPASASGSVTLAPGVVLAHQTFTFEGDPQSVWTVTVDLNSHNHLVSTTPQRVIGATRADLLSMGKAENAIAGVNGDTLYFVDPTSQPRGGVTYQGRTLKSPFNGEQSILYTTSANKANIGPVGFSGSMSTPNGTHVVNCYNGLECAKNGNMVVTDTNLLTRSSMKTVGNADAQKITPNCTQVVLEPSSTPGTYTAAAVSTNLTRYPRVPSGDHGLFTCGQADKDYLAQNVPVGTPVSLTIGYQVKNIISMISGVRQLVANGKAYNDTHGGLDTLAYDQLPQAFACIAKGGTHVLLGTVDGREKGATGMNYAQLTDYLVGRHCYVAMAMDGSTNSQLIAKRPGQALAFQNHLTNKNGNVPNGLVDGLLVTSR